MAANREYYVNQGKADAQAGKPASKFDNVSWRSAAYESGYILGLNEGKCHKVVLADDKPAQEKPQEAQPVAKPVGEGLAYYLAAVQGLKAKGAKLLAYGCPHCRKILKTLAAPQGDTWDSLSKCPHCDKVYMRFTQNRKAWGVRIEQ